MVVESSTIQNLGYGFLFALHSNYGPVWYRFRDTVRYWLKIATSGAVIKPIAAPRYGN